VQSTLLGRLVADPHAAQLPLHVLAVEHVPEEHLVAGERLPAREGCVTHAGGGSRTPHSLQVAPATTATPGAVG
jgi:hypothetical protein